MAGRRGRFGRRPRASGNLTALVAQLYREQRAAEDRVMFDAWQNGGSVDGKPVTDGRLRGYIAARRDGFSRDDPLYDDWNNRLVQIDFKIGEDKIQLAFQQGKVSAGAVASYYRGQLGKIAKDSAFYREVAGRAAQWSKAVGSAARGSARRRLSAGVDKGIAAAERQLANAEAVNDIVRRAAVRAGLINDNEAVTDADASRLQALFDAGIVGPKGTTVSFDDWRNSLMDAYRTFDARIAFNEQKNRGTKTLKEDKAKFFQGYILGTNAIDDRVKYEAARDVWLEAVQDAQGDPRAVLAANAKYASALEKIAKDAAVPTGNDATPDEFIGGLQNEINAVKDGEYTGPGVVDFYQRSDAGDFDGKLTEGDDTASTADAFARVNADAEALSKGTAYYGQSEYGGQMGVVYFPPGSEFDPFGRNGLGPDSQQAIVNINGKPTTVILKGKPVESTGLVNAAGEPVESVPDGAGGSIPVGSLTAGQVQSLLGSGQYQLSENSDTVGYVFQSGDKTTYGVIDPSTGDLRFTDKNPFSAAGALGLSEGGFTLVTGTGFDDAGEIVNVPPQINVGGGGDSLIVDPGISPRDLRRIAGNSIQDDQTAAELAALADKRQQEHADSVLRQHYGRERDVQQSDQGGVFGGVEQGVSNLVRSLLNVAATQKGQAATTAPPVLNLFERDRDKGPLSVAPPAIKTPPPPPPPAPTPTAGSAALLGAGAGTSGATSGGAAGALLGSGAGTSGAASGGAAGALLGLAATKKGKGGGGTMIAL